MDQYQTDDYNQEIIMKEIIKLEKNNNEILKELNNQKELINSTSNNIKSINTINKKNEHCLNYFKSSLLKHYFYSILEFINPFNYTNTNNNTMYVK